MCVCVCVCVPVGLVMSGGGSSSSLPDSPELLSAGDTRRDPLPDAGADSREAAAPPGRATFSTDAVSEGTPSSRLLSSSSLDIDSISCNSHVFIERRVESYNESPVLRDFQMRS